MKNKNKLLLFVLLAFVFLTKAGFVFADTAACQQLSDAITNIFKWAMEIVAVLSACVVAFGAIYFLIDYGRGSVQREGIEWIKAGLFGLILTLGVWLIAYTINPKLLTFDACQTFSFDKLKDGQGPGTSPFQPSVVNFKEIPIGMLAETLLTKKMDCYDFDVEGNPIVGEKMEDDDKTEFYAPTYMAHDRIDCYLKLSEAVEKKASIVEQLSKKINEKLLTCSCAKYGHCKDECLGGPTSTQIGVTPDDPEGVTVAENEGCKLINPDAPDLQGGGKCTGDCTEAKKAACKIPDDVLNNPLLRQQNPNDPNSMTCCPEEIKTQVRGYVGEQNDSTELGDGTKKKHQGVTPFSFQLTIKCSSNNGGGDCKSEVNPDYEPKLFGLDEFYTEMSGDSLKSVLEEKVKVDKKDVTYIKGLQDKNGKYCPSCISDCKATCGNDDRQCLDKQKECQNAQKKCITEDRPKCLLKTDWGKLNLIEQLTYLQQKLKDIKKEIEDDTSNLNSAASELSKCAIARSYIDLRQGDEATDKKTSLIKITQGQVNVRNYCDGFSYGNSQCYQKCSEMCPLTKDGISCYKEVSDIKCTECNDNTGSEACKKCQENKNKKMSECYRKRDCHKTNPDLTDFDSCMTKCGDNCQSVCSAKYLPCSEEFKACQTQCDNDSACLLGNKKNDYSDNNISNCILDPNVLSQCDANQGDEYANRCINNAYKCQSGSQQNAGYPDCLKDPTGKYYSSSYLYVNPEKQKCNPDKNLDNYLVLQYNCTHSTDQAKCPLGSFLSHSAFLSGPNFNSNCTECMCGSAADDKGKPIEFTFTTEKKVNPKELDVCKGEEDKTNGGQNTECDAPKKYPNPSSTPPVDDFRIVGPTCSQPAYNDDPLTFYCRSDWWNEPETKRTINLGASPTDSSKNMVCSKSGEVPSGTMVDDANAWESAFLSTGGKVADNLQKLLDTMKNTGKAKKYCQCDSVYEESQNPVCKACCQYQEGDPGKTPAQCNFEACHGNSCQQMINWLESIIDEHTDIKTATKDLYVSLFNDPRSDVLKELTYSRNQTNTCSTYQNESGQTNSRLLNCQRIIDEIISSVTTDGKLNVDQKTILRYCYGTDAAKIYSVKGALDNWFCCQTTKPQAETKDSMGDHPNFGPGLGGI